MWMKFQEKVRMLCLLFSFNRSWLCAWLQPSRSSQPSEKTDGESTAWCELLWCSCAHSVTGTEEGADSDPGWARRTSQKSQYLNLEGFSQESKETGERLTEQKRHDTSGPAEQRTVPLSPGFTREDCREMRQEAALGQILNAVGKWRVKSAR